MKEHPMPIKVIVVVRGVKMNVSELLKELQEIADEWFWKQQEITPCEVVK